MSKAAFPKTDRLREMREERHKEDISQGKRIVKALRQAVEHARGNTELATTHIVTVPAVVADLNAAAAAIGAKGGKSKSPAKVAAEKPVTLHSDCPDCERHAEQTRLRVQKHRQAKEKSKD